MQELRNRVVHCIRTLSLPTSLDSFSEALYDTSSQSFVVQESVHWDYKDIFPNKMKSEYGSGIIRLICAFHNTYGGIIIFGVDDDTKRPIGNPNSLDIERLNALLRDRLSATVECVHRTYTIPLPEQKDVSLDFLLVPKRESGTEPIRTVKQLSKYSPGCIFHRQGHEVLQATSITLPFLYTSRADYGIDPERRSREHIEHSMPPSASTMREFIGRRDVMDRLWRWLIYDDDPRLYLYGRGGSGKSTIAYDFARRVVESWARQPIADGHTLDLVVYLSAKVRELNPVRGKISQTPVSDFSTAREQFIAIVEAAGGFGSETPSELTDDTIVERLKAVFREFTILLVIDDIDTLTTKGLDSGSDTLYRILIRSPKGGKILYTLREEPLLSVNQSQIVPGLDLELEYVDFVDSCSKQFSVSVPSPEFMIGTLAETSECLPLVIETIIGLRRTTSNYNEAIALWNDKRGEEAREYLFRREYDRLSADNRARNLLLVLALLEEPVPSSVLLAILQCTPNQLSDAIAAVKDLFIRIDDDSEEQSLFSVGAVTRAFVNKVSVDLTHYQTLCERVAYFMSERISQPPEVSAVVLQVERRLIEDDVVGAKEYLESLQMSPRISEHPRIMSISGKIYSKLAPPNLEFARKHFHAVISAEYLDRNMMRDWFYMELNQGLFSRAAKVCRMVIDRDGFSAAAKSEFHGKRGLTYMKEARQLIADSPTTGIGKYESALNAYGATVDLSVRNERLDVTVSLRHLESCLREFAGSCVKTGHQSNFLEYWSRDAVGRRLNFDVLKRYLMFVCAQMPNGTVRQLVERRSSLHMFRNRLAHSKARFECEDVREYCLAIVDKATEELQGAIEWRQG